MVKRHPLSKKDKKRLLEKLAEIMAVDLDEKVVEYYSDGKVEGYLVEGKPLAILVNGVLIPHLKAVYQGVHVNLPKVYVDEGATRALLRGADLMVPGVKKIEGSFKNGDLVLVIDEKSNKPVAIGEAVISSEILESLSEKRGKILRILHHVGDSYWDI